MRLRRGVTQFYCQRVDLPDQPTNKQPSADTEKNKTSVTIESCETNTNARRFEVPFNHTRNTNLFEQNQSSKANKHRHRLGNHHMTNSDSGTLARRLLHATPLFTPHTHLNGLKGPARCTIQCATTTRDEHTREVPASATSPFMLVSN